MAHAAAVLAGVYVSAACATTPGVLVLRRAAKAWAKAVALLVIPPPRRYMTRAPWTEWPTGKTSAHILCSGCSLSAASPVQVVQTLAVTMFEEEGFCGNRQNY